MTRFYHSCISGHWTVIMRQISLQMSHFICWLCLTTTIFTYLLFDKMGSLNFWLWLIFRLANLWCFTWDETNLDKQNQMSWLIDKLICHIYSAQFIRYYQMIQYMKCILVMDSGTKDSENLGCVAVLWHFKFYILKC